MQINYTQPSFTLFPESGSAGAVSVDHLMYFHAIVDGLMVFLIFVTIVIFAGVYRRKSDKQIPKEVEGNLKLEIAWSVIPFMVMLVMFAWGSLVYFQNEAPPKNAYNIYVVGKQWMWKVQYPEGQREIDELHVPVGRPIRLTMASEDVIHSFFIPAFRVKHDVVPGHYENLYFVPTKPGRYHIFCAEYCGTQHSGMIGWVTVMEPTDFQNWLAGGGESGSMAQQGEKLFQQLGCSTCHLLDEQGRCPILRGLYGSRVLLSDGRTVIADDAYIRESILYPNEKIAAGFQRDIMPTFDGQISEEGILQLIEYVKSLAIKQTGIYTSSQTGQDRGPNRAGSIVNENGNLQTQGTTMTPIPGRPGATQQIQRRFSTGGNPNK